MTRARQYIVLVTALLVCAAPGLAGLWAETVANAHGCTLTPERATPCRINGIDRGAALATARRAGLFIYFTLPVLVIFTALLGLRLWRDLSPRR